MVNVCLLTELLWYLIWCSGVGSAFDGASVLLFYNL